MAGHWCDEHGTAFFKKGKMKGYAHPIKDESGEDTGEWCNAPEEASKASQATQPNDEMTKADWDEKQRIERSSIEGQTACKVTTELLIAGKIGDTDALAEALKSYLLLKLGMNMGGKVEVFIDTPPKGTFGEEEIKALLNNAGVTQKQASDILIEKFKVPKKPSVMEMIKGLDKVQMKWFLESITEKVGVDIPPEEIPF